MDAVDFYILEKEQPLQVMLQKLHSILISCAPHMEARLTYNIPFYYYFGRLCYLNPKENSLEMGFCRGAMMNQNELLSRTELKEVRIIKYANIQEIREENLLPLIYEAMILNELTKKRKS
jgi:hypothetical protein